MPRASRQGRSARRKERQGRGLEAWLPWVAGLTGVVAVAAVIIGMFASACAPVDAEDDKPIVVELRHGEGPASLGARLSEEGLIRNAGVFRVMARLVAQPQRWRAGRYRLSRAVSVREVLAVLDEARPMPRRLTVPEGTDLPGLAQLVVKEGAGQAGTWDALCRDPARFADGRPWLADLPEGATLEGYLFPDTYALPDHAGRPEALVGRMLDRFGQVAWPVVREGTHGLSPRAWLALASIVEREAVLAAERPLIAGVFLERLEAGMPLGSDPTVEYVLGFRQTVDRPLTRRDIAIDSPWNTYRVRGLPPGPICNPGLASILAVRDAVGTDKRYFVARGDGSHVFSRTHAAHRAAVRAVRSRQRSATQD